MDIKKQDLGIKKTEYLLTTALTNLLRAHPFSRITVDSICIEAMVSRSTFYKHFEDKYALLRYTLHLMNRKRIINLEGKPLSEYIYSFLEHIKAESVSFRNILSSGHNKEVLEIVLEPHFTNIKNAMIHKLKNDTSIPVDVAAYYHASAVVSTIIMWVDQNMSYSTEEMSSYLTQMLPAELKEMKLHLQTQHNRPIKNKIQEAENEKA